MKNIVLITITIFCLKMNAQVGFTSVNCTTNMANKNIVSADFDNDGDLDIIVANGSINGLVGLEFLSGNGLGTFGTAVSIVISNSSIGVGGMISGDFNNDGNHDISLLASGFSFGPVNYMQILFGDGTGNFPTSDTTNIPSVGRAITSSDVNGDGHVDFLIIRDGGMNVLLGDSAGNFVNSFDFVAGGSMNAITSADFNGDGNMDVAATNNGNGGAADSVWVWLGNGAGSFGTAAKYLAGAGPASVASSDFNGDGFADIVVGNNNSNDVSVFISQGANGLFNASVNYITANQPFSVTTSDFNLDGKADIAVANLANNVSVLLGTGTGSFIPALTFPASGGPWAIISRDFNADGRPDIATACQSSSKVNVFLNDSSMAVPVTPRICLVTADSTHNYNIVVWEKENSNMSSVDSFLVYREISTNNYAFIGFVLYDSLSVFNDYNANPSSTAFRYKLKSKSVFGIESVNFSNYHNTMYLTNNGANFSWTPYQIENNTTPVANYYVYRDDNSTGNFASIGSTTGNQTGYTDINFSSFPNASYYVEAVMANGACAPTRSVVNGSTSNVIYFGSTGTEQFTESLSITVFPNPTSSILNIAGIKGLTKLLLYDALGKLVFEKEASTNSVIMDIKSLKDGFYTLLTENADGRTFHKIMIANK